MQREGWLARRAWAAPDLCKVKTTRPTNPRRGMGEAG